MNVLASKILSVALTLKGAPPRAAASARTPAATAHAERASPWGDLRAGLAYVWNFQIVQIAGSAVASTVTYLTPLVATALGIGLLGERVGFPQFVGGILVLVSAALVQQRLRLSH